MSLKIKKSVTSVRVNQQIVRSVSKVIDITRSLKLIPVLGPLRSDLPVPSEMYNLVSFFNTALQGCVLYR